MPEWITSDQIKSLLKKHEEKMVKMEDLYKRYRADSVPINKRDLPEYVDETTQTKLVNDFFGEIVDTKVGYMASIPISYTLSDEEKDSEELLREIKYFNDKNNIEDLDAETTKMCAICGKAYRLLYFDDGAESQAEPFVMNVDPWEMIVIKDRSGNNINYALRTFMETRVVDGKEVELRVVEAYDDEKIYFLIEDSPNGEFVLDNALVASEEIPINPLKHNFLRVPVVEFENNKEQLGDCDKVLTLIDDYDYTFSDQSSELKQFAQAYMACEGAKFDEDSRKEAKKSGCINIPVGAKVYFIEKKTNIEVIKDMKEDLKKNITRFAKHVDFTDQNTAGNLTQMAIFIRLLALEAKCMTFERKMVRALRKQWQILSEAFSMTKFDLNYLNMSFVFTRNIPVNVQDEAETLKTLIEAGMPIEEALEQISFVKDATALAEKWKEEKAALTGEESTANSEGFGARSNPDLSGEGEE